MSVYIQASASIGPGPHHGRSASDQPIPSTLHYTPKSRPYINGEGPSTHPRPKQQRQNCFQISNPQATQSLNAGPPNNPPYPSPQVNQVFHAGPPNNPSYPSPQVNDAGHPYHPKLQLPQPIPFQNTHTLFTNAVAVQAHSAGLYYNTNVLTRRKHWYFVIQITVPPPSIMSVRHDMTARQRARARLHQLTVNKRSLNEQRAFIYGSSEKMEARLEVLEVQFNSQSHHIHILTLAFRPSIRTQLNPIRSYRNCTLWRLLWKKQMTI